MLAVDKSQISVATFNESLSKVVKTNIDLISDRHQEISYNISQILTSLIDKGVSSHIELDAKVRPSYVIMQGLIEKTLTEAKISGMCESVKCYIITPRMPTPLMRAEGKEVTELNMGVATDFADYRKPILEKFLDAQNVINAVYCKDAREKVQATDEKGLQNYEVLLARYQMVLKDLPVLNVEMSKFPAHIAGAVYDVDGIRIAIESRQVSQIDYENKAQWSIKIGEQADGRFAELNEFLQSADSGIMI